MGAAEPPDSPLAGLATSPLPALAVSFMLGLLCAEELPSLVKTAAWAAIFPIGGAAYALARRGARRSAGVLLALTFALGGAVVSAALPAEELGPGSPDGPGPCTKSLHALGLPTPESAPVELELVGVSVAPARVRPSYATLRLAATRLRPGREPDGAPAAWSQADGLLIELGAEAGALPLLGESVRARVRLDDPEAATPSGAARSRRLRREGVRCVGRVLPGQLAVLEPTTGIRAAFEHARLTVVRALRKSDVSPPRLALLAALAVGDRSLVTDAQADRFARSGLAHVLSVSGLHLTLLVLGVFRLLVVLLRRTPLGRFLDPVRVAALACLPLAPAYALFTGGEAPVVRAAIGTGLYLTARAIAQAPDPAAAIGAAALAILAAEPAALWDPSFQLSFAACAGLLALCPGLRALVPVARAAPDAPLLRRVVEWPLGALVTTAAATLATTPLGALHFGATSLAGLPANVVALPVALAATTVSALLAVGLLVVPALASPLIAVAAPIVGALDWLAERFAALPLSRIVLAPPALHEMAAFWILAICLASLVRAPRRSLLVAALAAVVLWAPRAETPDGLLRIDFLPVGQGDATLLRLPHGGEMLIDGGGDLRGARDVGDRVIVPQLLALGVRSLDAVVVSHLHPDHVGGLPAVLRSLPVGALWTTGRPLEGRFGEPLARAAEEAKVPRLILARGAAPIVREDVRFEILGPPDRDGLRDEPLFSENDASLVLRVVHGDVAILLAGDVEQEGEEALVASGARLEAQLLKAPHHGSSTSSSTAFLRRVSPTHVVFCVGHRNPFGFPRADVVERYARRGCQMHRTDRGRVSFESDGEELRLVSPR